MIKRESDIPIRLLPYFRYYNKWGNRKVLPNQDCGKEFFPVCAKGKTYNNPCLAAKLGIKEVSLGACDQVGTKPVAPAPTPLLPFWPLFLIPVIKLPEIKLAFPSIEIPAVPAPEEPESQPDDQVGEEVPTQPRPQPAQPEPATPAQPEPAPPVGPQPAQPEPAQPDLEDIQPQPEQPQPKNPRFSDSETGIVVGEPPFEQ